MMNYAHREASEYAPENVEVVRKFITKGGKRYDKGI